jgi:hypothetical protein
MPLNNGNDAPRQKVVHASKEKHYYIVFERKMMAATDVVAS